MGVLTPEFVESCVKAFREHGAKHYPGCNWDNCTDRDVFIFAQWVARGCPEAIRPTKLKGDMLTEGVPLTAEELIEYFENMEAKK